MTYNKLNEDLLYIKSSIQHFMNYKSDEIKKVISSLENENYTNFVSTANKINYCEKLLEGFENILKELFAMYLKVEDERFKENFFKTWNDISKQVSIWRFKLDKSKAYYDLVLNEFIDGVNQIYTDFKEFLFDRDITFNNFSSIKLKTGGSIEKNGFKFDKTLSLLNILDNDFFLSYKNASFVEYKNYFMINIFNKGLTFFVSNEFGMPTYIVEDDVVLEDITSNSLDEITQQRGGFKLLDIKNENKEDFEDKLIESLIGAEYPSTMEQTDNENNQFLLEYIENNNFETNTNEEKFIRSIKYHYLTGKLDSKTLEDETLWDWFVENNFEKENIPFNNWEEFRKYLENYDYINNHYSTSYLLFSHDSL